jgi:hypothetical protein
MPRLRERDGPGWDMAGVTGPAVGDSLTGAAVDIRPSISIRYVSFYCMKAATS